MGNVLTKDIFAYLDSIAPVGMKLEFDNVGHLVGRQAAEVHRVLVALDITDQVIDEAISQGVELIVAHHPLIFKPCTHVTDADTTGRKLIALLRHDIGAICMHTNLDAAAGGVNDVLAQAVGLVDPEILWNVGELDGVPYGLGRVGALSAAQTMPDFLAHVKQAVGATGLRYHDAGRPVQRVAVMGGSGSDALELALGAGCDTYVLGEAKYSAFLQAKEQGLNLIEADHFCTENLVSAPLAQKLAKQFPALTVTVSAHLEQTAQFYM